MAHGSEFRVEGFGIRLQQHATVGRNYALETILALFNFAPSQLLLHISMEACGNVGAL